MPGNQKAGDIGEIEIVDLVPCPNCGKKLTNIPEPYLVMWKIKNSGVEALKAKKIRGEINPDSGFKKREGETALYSGVHYVECYAIKDGVYIAKDRKYLRIP